MPIFAPVEIPFGPEIGIGGLAPVDVCVAEIEDCVVTEIDDCVVVVKFEGVVVMKLEDVRAAEENAFRSELCHHTGTPSPNIVQLVTVVV
jgi:hypothetical protein